MFVHVDELKLCPAPDEARWSPDVSTTKSLCASAVVDVSGWEDVASHHSSHAAIGELDRPIDLTGHVLSPFFIRNMDYMDSRFHSIPHVLPLCY